MGRGRDDDDNCYHNDHEAVTFIFTFRNHIIPIEHCACAFLQSVHTYIYTLIHSLRRI